MAEIKLFINHEGEHISLHALAKRHGLPPKNVRERYHKGFRGDALVAPLRTKSKHGQAKPKPPTLRAQRKKTIHGMLGSHTPEEISQAVGIKPHSVRQHIRDTRHAYGDKLIMLPALAVAKLLQGESPWALDDFLREDLLLRLREAGFPVDLGPRINWE